jgi:hypothetical protein
LTFDVTIGLRPVSYEVCQDLGHDCTSLFKVNNVLRELHCLFTDSVGGISIAEDIVQWLVCEHADYVRLKIVVKLSCTHYYYVTYFSISEYYFLEPVRALDTKYTENCCIALLSFYDLFFLNQGSAHSIVQGRDVQNEWLALLQT